MEKELTTQKAQRRIWNTIAPNWNLSRQKPLQKIALILKKYAETWQHGKILDIGCGNCRNLLSFSYNEFSCYGIDFSNKMLEMAGKYCKKHMLNVNLKQAYATQLPFKSQYFDYVLSIFILHHLNKDERMQAIREIWRVLKYKGKALIILRNKLQLRFLFKKKDIFIPWHVRKEPYQRYYYLFTPWELKRFLREEKFKILSSNTFGKDLIILISKS